MSWEDEVKRRDAKPVVCVEIALDSGILYYADRDFREAGTFWEGRVLKVGPITRGVDLNGNSLLINDVSIEFNNNEPDSATGNGHFGNLLPPVHSWEGKTVNIYLKFVDDAGAVQSQKMFSGLCEPVDLTSESFTLEVRPSIREKINLLQRVIKGIEFGTFTVPDKSIGQGLNIILGTVSANKGAVFCPQIDSATNAQKFCVAQHAVKSIDDVFAKRGDVFEELTPTTHYTPTTSATDSDGEVYSYITLTATATTSGMYADGDEIYVNAKGVHSGGTLYENPALAFEQLLLQFTELKVSDIDATSITAAGATCTTRAYDTPGYFGTCIPFENSGNRIESANEPWPALQAIAKGFHHQIYVTTDGKIGLTSIDILSTSEPSGYYRERDGDFTESGVSVAYRPVRTVNERRDRWKVAQSVQSGTQGVTLCTNTVSINTIGKRESEGLNRTAQNDLVLQDILNREMLLSSGNAVTITWTVPGLWGMQSGSDVGGLIALTHARVIGRFIDQTLQIVSISANLISGEVTIEALAIGSSFYQGNISIESLATSQVQFLVESSVDTYVDAGAQGTQHGNDSPIIHGSYLHHDSGEFEFEELIRRAVFRFPTTEVGTNSTVLDVALRIYIEAVHNKVNYEYYPPIPLPTLDVRRLNSTAWTTNSTYSSFDGAAWSDSKITTAYSNVQTATAGYMQFTLNASAKSYIQTQVTAGNPVELSLSATGQSIASVVQYLNDNYDPTFDGGDNGRDVYITSEDHATTSWRPTLIIVALV